MRISDWSADVCSSDLNQDRIGHHALAVLQHDAAVVADGDDRPDQMLVHAHAAGDAVHDDAETLHDWKCSCCIMVCPAGPDARSEEHTSELQSLMRISYAVFCLKKKKK